MLFNRFVSAPAFCLLLLGTGVVNHANANSSHSQTQQQPLIRELNWLNEQFLIKQRKTIESLSRQHLGRSLQTGPRNISILQRLVDLSVIEKDDTLSLQALGVVLGDMIADSHKKLEWQVYEDDQGKSHAVCLLNSEHCLFPVTMISRRVEVGAPVNIQAIYDKSLDLIKPVLPKLPFER